MLTGIGGIKVKLHRPMQGTIKMVTLKRSCGRWYAIVTCEVAPQPVPAAGQSVGIDLGLTDFLVTDAGATVANPRPVRRAEAGLRRAHQALSRKRRGSRRRRKLAETVAQQLLGAVRHLPPGTRLPSETELTQMLGVGRSIVREALNGLALLGVVEIRHDQGVLVSAEPTTSVAPADPDAIALALAKGVTRDLLEARQIVEVAIARLAAERRTEAELREIEAVLA